MAEIIGTGNSETLNGTIDDDLIKGGAGNDTILGNEGADDLRGQDGDDLLQGGLGEDLLVGGADNDVLQGGEDNDNLLGQAGDDDLDGGAGTDILRGGLGNDTYRLTDALDTIVEAVNEGTDTVIVDRTFALSSTLENLTLTGVTDINGTGNNADNVIIGNDGANVLRGGAGADTISGGGGADIVLGNDGDDDLSGDAGDDTLVGKIGNDVLDGGAGADRMFGGLGDDTYVVDDAGDFVREQIGQGVDRVQSEISFTISATVEELELIGAGDIDGTGTNEANVIIGNAGDNELRGGGGIDNMSGGAGADLLLGQGGDDVLDGGDNDDVLSGGVGVDTLRGESGDDRLFGGDDDDSLDGGIGNDTLDGGVGADNLVGGVGDDAYRVDNVGDVTTEQAGEGVDEVHATISTTLQANIEVLTLEEAGGAIDGTGNADANTLEGNSSANRLDGAAGADQMVGGGGDDTYVVDDAGDTTVELAGEGTDTVEASISVTLAENVENLTLAEAAGAIDGTGNSAANVLTGNSAVNTLTTGGGADTVNAGDGDDIISISDTAFSVIDGGVGADILRLDADNLSVNLTARAPNISNLEAIDLRGSENGALDITAADIASLSGGTEFFVLGDADNTVNAGDGWSSDGPVNRTVGAESSTFNSFSQAGVTLLVESSVVSVTIGLAAPNQAPTVDLSGVAEAGFDFDTRTTTDGAAIVLADGNALISDPDSGQDIGSMTVTVTNAGVANEALSLTANGAFAASLLGVAVSGGGTTALTLTGEASSDQYESLLAEIRYANSEQTFDLDPAARTVEIQVTDAGGLTSNTAVANVILDARVTDTTDVRSFTGDEGDDIITAGVENSTLNGGDGDDTLNGGDGDDTLNGGADDDIINGGAGNDQITYDVGDGVDVIDGGAGNDDLVVVQGDATGNQFDVTVGASTTIEVNESTSDDVTLSNVESLSIIGGSEADTVNLTGDFAGTNFRQAIATLSDGNDTYDASGVTSSGVFLDAFGGAGDDTLTGGSGDIRLIGGAGNDALDGGSGGTNTALYSGNFEDFTISVVEGALTITDGDALASGDEGVDTLVNIDSLSFGGGATTAHVVGAGGFATISAAVTAASAGDIILVAPGTYTENVVLDKAVTLLSFGGSDVTTITGVGAGAELGAIQVTNGVDGAQIGGIGNGFTITGINGNGAVEKAAIYLQGSQDGLTIQGNDVVANGDAGLLSEFGGTLQNAIIDTNTFSGQTFEGSEPGGDGFATQFNAGNNVPRQLVTIGEGGSGPHNSGNITFTNNLISGQAGESPTTAGGPDGQGNTLVTIDVDGADISDNTFTGETARFATGLRARGPNTNIENNSFDNSSGGDTRGVFVQDQGAPGTYGGNTFTGGDSADIFFGSPGDDSMTGAGGDDTLVGNAGNDTLTGDDGSDLLVGGLGDDVLNGDSDGGLGLIDPPAETRDVLPKVPELDIDTAEYSGNRADSTVTVTTNAAGFVTDVTEVTDDVSADGDEGTDTLQGIEVLTFADVSLDLTDDIQLFNGSGDLVGTFDTLQAAVTGASAGDTIRLDAGEIDTSAQIVIDKDLTIIGAGIDETTVTKSFDTGSAGDARGWFLVTAGVDLDVSGVTFDGEDTLTFQGFRHLGTGSFDEVGFSNIDFNSSGPTYQGTAIAAFGGAGAVDVTDSSFDNIGRVGVLYFGAGTTGLFEGNSYTGKGDVDGLDYALDISGGAVVNVVNNTVSDNLGVASSDGSTSAAFLVSTFFGPGTQATFSGNTLDNNSTGIFSGFNSADTSQVTINSGNVITNTGDGAGLIVVGDGVVTGTANLTGDGADVNWFGGDAANTMTGAALDDILSGGAGADTMTGGDGDDLYGADASDVIIEGVDGGIDEVQSSESITLADNVENLTLTDVDSSGEGASGTGNVLANEIVGNNIDNALSGLGGDDTLSGADGDDTMTGGEGADALNGGAGSDTATYAGQSGDFTISAGTIVVTDTNVGDGDEGADTLTGVEVIEFADKSVILVGGDSEIQSIQDAVDAATAGDTIIVAAGTYNENVSIDKALTIIGAGDDETTGSLIKPGSGVGFSIDTTDPTAAVSISGFRFDGEFTSVRGINADGGDGARDQLASLSISDSTFTGFMSNAVSMFDFLGGTVTTSITDSTFFANGGLSGSSGDGDVIFFQYAGDATLERLSFTGTEGDFAGRIPAENAINFRDDDEGMGAVSLTDITIDGVYEKQAIIINNFDDLSNLTFTNVDVNAESTRFKLAVNFTELGGGIDLSGANFVNFDTSDAFTILLDEHGVPVLDAGGLEIQVPVPVAVQGDGGDQTLIGGDEINFIRGDEVNPTAPGVTFGDDTLTGNGGDDIIVGDVGVDLAVGGADIISGGDGDDTLSGNGGDDLITGGADNDIIDGGQGVDTVTLTGNTADYTRNDLGEGVTEIVDGTAERDGSDTVQNVEVIEFADGSTFFVGGGSAITTIQQAVDLASDGDTIIVAAGTFTDAVSIDKGLTIIGAGDGAGGTSIEVAAGNAFTLATNPIGGASNAVTISGFNFDGQGTAQNGIFADGDFGQAEALQSLTVTDSTITGFLSNGMTVRDYDEKTNLVTTVENTTFSANGGNGGGGDGDLQFFQYGADATIRNVDITGATPPGAGQPPRTGLQFRSDQDDMGTVLIEDLTIDGAYRNQGILITGYSDIDGLTMTNVDVTGADSFFFNQIINFSNVGGDVDLLDTNQFTNVTFTDDASNGGATADVLSLQGNAPEKGFGGNNTLSGTNSNDFLRGDETGGSEFGDDVLSGNGGDDTIVGDNGAADAGANDVINGNDGDDQIAGNGGDDVITGGADNDLISGDDGDDRINYTVGDGIDTVSGGADTDTLAVAGTAAVDELSVTVNGAGALEFEINNSGVADITADTIENLEINLGDEADIFTIAGDLSGSTLADVTALNGDAGDDRLDASGVINNFGFTMNGGAGADDLFGGAGDDVLIGGVGNDLLNGGDGSDTADYSADTQGVVVNLAAATPLGFGVGVGSDQLVSIENVLGGSGNDILVGSAIGNSLSGGDGDDVINGNAGIDVISGGAGADTMSGGDNDEANDTLNGGKPDSAVDEFSFVSLFGNDTVNGFEDGFDQVTIDISGLSASAQVFNSDSGADHVITVIDGLDSASVTLSGQAGNIDGSDFTIIS